MYYAGIDLHRNDVVIAIEDQQGVGDKPRRFPSREPGAIVGYLAAHRPFQAVVEASCGYRWLYDLLTPLGTVVLAHPRRLRAIVDGRAKTDKLDAALLARLLRADLIPRAYVPPVAYAQLRDLTRARARLVRHEVEAKNELHALLARRNIHPPFKTPFGKRWTKWVAQTPLGVVEQAVRAELLRRLEHYAAERERLDQVLAELAPSFPEVEALLCLRGVGLYTALLLVAEIGEPQRFADGRQVAAYAGLTARVNQSGGHCYHGHITRQGSSWLRWALVQVAMKILPGDPALQAFYTRLRKRSSAKIARVAVARKLAAICWLRLMRWHYAAGIEEREFVSCAVMGGSGPVLGTGGR